ncbi:hypothetical protein GTO10_02590 [Candidatus Saccharibacteria bacterium]|nr:hypothetical protein [Candidatus Saccharibacteria bacterium]
MDSPKTILKTLKAAKIILIPFHRRPDGDMVGSALAVYHFLKSLGKKSILISADPIPENFLFLPGAKRIKMEDPAELDLSDIDVILLLDNGDPFRFTKNGRVDLPPKLLMVNIDHHDSNRGFGDLNYVVPKAASTTEILFDLFKAWRIPIGDKIATCLLTGIYTDTAGFLLPKTSHGTISKAGELVKKGGDRKAVVDKAFQSWPVKAFRVWTTLLDNAKLKGSVAYSTLSYQEVKALGCTPADLAAARGFAAGALLLAVDKVKRALVFSEETPKTVRVSMRAKPGFSVDRVAKQFGGGGHTTSSAFDFEGPLKKAVSKTLHLIR